MPSGVAVPGDDPQRLPGGGVVAGGDEDFTGMQDDQAGILLETHIDCSGRVKRELRAVGEAQFAAFAGRGAVFGEQAVTFELALCQPARG